jgi:hypothetical protein
VASSRKNTMKIRLYYKVENFTIIWASISFWKKGLSLGFIYLLKIIVKITKIDTT